MNVPELLSPTYRNRVRNLSPRNRNSGVQHLPGSHTLSWTKTEANLGIKTAGARSLSALSQVRMAEDKRFELLRGLHPNTLSSNAGLCSPASATVRELRKHEAVNVGERLRTGMNETETETTGQAAHRGAARPRSDAR